MRSENSLGIGNINTLLGHTCEPLKSLIYPPKIQLHILKKEKERRMADNPPTKAWFSRKEEDKHNQRLL